MRTSVLKFYLKITPLNSEEIDFMVAWMSSKHFKDQLKTKGG